MGRKLRLICLAFFCAVGAIMSGPTAPGVASTGQESRTQQDVAAPEIISAGSLETLPRNGTVHVYGKTEDGEKFFLSYQEGDPPAGE